jgi:hypothetical protein
MPPLADWRWPDHWLGLLLLLRWLGLWLVLRWLGLLLLLCWLGLLFVGRLLREGRNSGSEKQEQDCFANDSEYFHEYCLHYQRIHMPGVGRLARFVVFGQRHTAHPPGGKEPANSGVVQATAKSLRRLSGRLYVRRTALILPFHRSKSTAA